MSFLSLAALLSFDGLLGGLGSSEDGSVFVGPATSVAAAPVGAGTGGGGATGARGAGGAAPGAGVPGGGVPGGVEGTGTAPGVTAPGTPPPSGSPAAPTSTSGPLSNTVQTLENTTENTTGLGLPLTEQRIRLPASWTRP
ncbi:MAG TPA: hypothetical protein VK920_10535 [Solirubrobacterales bacterium]|nr:hypothetical protein [Solirubrobacterales bacterium]